MEKKHHFWSKASRSHLLRRETKYIEFVNFRVLYVGIIKLTLIKHEV